ncbi:MAG TPA: hypothetical protein VHB25_20000 [Gemmatimonadaceae bacterium]|nr:hypothetical protein [Gemmatimonadaceae bacterium]
MAAARAANALGRNRIPIVAPVAITNIVSTKTPDTCVPTRIARGHGMTARMAAAAGTASSVAPT